MIVCSLFVLCLIVLLNCLLNVFAICVSDVSFSLIVIVLFLGCVGFVG